MTSVAAPLPARRPTEIDAIADAHLATASRLDPVEATFAGVTGHDHEMVDLSPAGHAARADAARATLTQLASARPADEVDAVTLAAMRERLGLQVELAEAHEVHAELNNIASPAQILREVFDLMPTGDVEGWESVAARLNALPQALTGYADSLRLAAAHGRVPARRQVELVLAEASALADPASSFFTSFVHGPEAEAVLDGSASCQRVRGELEHGARAATTAYAGLAAFLRDELAPAAPAEDAAGRERYALWSRYFLGARVDLEETYAWGLDELARVTAEQEAVARQIAGPGATIADAIAVLDADPSRRLDGTAALQRWMTVTSEAAITALDGTHFTIPEPVRALECLIAPSASGGIYYTGPSDDFARPGRMWWSVPDGVTQFTTWREKTTVFHEGVPGHHLQIATAVHERARLNSWRRLGCWVSGHGEGWALYAERLMADLGFLDDPGDLLGMLDAQRLRAARVVVDLGVHLGLRAPEAWGGGTWDASSAWELLRANVASDEATLRFELDRYLGWPGQAPSYKIGQRLWEQARDEARQSALARGEEFDLAAFHARALSLGALGLDVLGEALRAP